MTLRIHPHPRRFVRRASAVLRAGLAALALGPLAAQATYIDFDALPVSTNASGAPNNVASVLTTQLADLGVVFGRAGLSAGVAVVAVPTLDFSPPAAIVGLDANGLIPAFASGDIHFSFVVPGTLLPAVTDSVSFQVGDTCCDIDAFTIRAYDLAGMLLDEQDIASPSHQSWSLSLPGIHRIEVLNVSAHDGGYALDNLQFAVPTRVPEPSTLLLAAVAVAGLRRRARSAGNGRSCPGRTSP